MKNAPTLNLSETLGQYAVKRGWGCAINAVESFVGELMEEFTDAGIVLADDEEVALEMTLREYAEDVLVPGADVYISEYKNELSECEEAREEGRRGQY